MNVIYRFVILAIFIFGLGFSCAATSLQAEPEQPDRQFEAISRLIEKADQALEAGNTPEATQLYGATIAAYRDFLTRFPEHQSNLIQFRMSYCRNQLMGLLAAKSEPKTEAEAAAAIPDDIAHPIGQAIGLCRASQFSEAENLLRPLLETHPDYAPAYLVLATAALGRGAMEESKQMLEHAISLDDAGSAAARYNMAQLLIREASPDIEQAKVYYQRAREQGAVADPDLEAVLDL